ncbi:MAG: energy-coupled thiamine transporter ThiT [Firmicutes bacterium]|nr:energy-coupled thiamine transporter ThiT [Bacillota bacterium]
MTLQDFFSSTAGQICSIAAIVVLFGLILWSGRGRQLEPKVMAISALLVALSVILNQISIFKMPQGGAITFFGMVPIVLCAYFYGVRRALMAGMCVGLVYLVFNPYVIHPVQLLLDYPLAFGALAFGGFFANRKHGLVIGYVFGVFCRYICNFLSGAIFFGAYAPEGFNAVTWSLWYNATYLGVEMIITVILLSLPPVRNLFEHLKYLAGERHIAPPRTEEPQPDESQSAAD